MAEVSNQQREITVQMDDTPFGANLEVPYIDADPSTEMHNASEELTTEQTETDESAVVDPDHFPRTSAFLSIIKNRDNNDSVPRRAGNLANETEEFILGTRRFCNNTFGRELPTDTEELFSMRLPAWNTVLQLEQGETLVTRLNIFLTIVGFILYIVDLGSDIATAIFFASNGQWWQAIVTLAIVYTAVIFYTVLKWRLGRISCTGAADWLRYVASLLVNWPEVKYYGALCRLEWQLHRSPWKNAHLVPEWNLSRSHVAYLKFSEGMCEACPQAILQLCLLVPDLYGAWTWTDYLRIAGASVSLCTAGAALVNWEKFNRIAYYTDLPLSELAVLHVWAVPVTVSRLLSVALLLSVHPYWALAGGALLLVPRGVYWCRTDGVPRDVNDVIIMCLDTVLFCMSPFVVADSMKYRRMVHIIHLLVNTGMTVVWALGTPLVCAHPALYTAIICFSAVMLAVGLVGWQLHERHWPGSYPNNRKRRIML